MRHAIILIMIVAGITSTAYAQPTEYICWTITDAKTVMRSQMDGSSAVIIADTSPLIPFGVALDIVEGAIFVATSSDSGNPGTILRFGLDGTNVTSFLGGLPDIRGVEIDPSERMLYFGTRGESNGFVSTALVENFWLMPNCRKGWLSTYRQ